MTKNEIKAAIIFRLLSEENKERLLEWVQIAFVAESSVRQPRGFESPKNGGLRGETQDSSCQENSCGDIL